MRSRSASSMIYRRKESSDEQGDRCQQERAAGHTDRQTGTGVGEDGTTHEESKELQAEPRRAIEMIDQPSWRADDHIHQRRPLPFPLLHQIRLLSSKRLRSCHRRNLQSRPLGNTLKRLLHLRDEIPRRQDDERTQASDDPFGKDLDDGDDVSQSLSASGRSGDADVTRRLDGMKPGGGGG